MPTALPPLRVVDYVRAPRNVGGPRPAPAPLLPSVAVFQPEGPYEQQRFGERQECLAARACVEPVREPLPPAMLVGKVGASGDVSRPCAAAAPGIPSSFGF